jgi:hypothetical protein
LEASTLAESGIIFSAAEPNRTSFKEIEEADLSKEKVLLLYDLA